jgi:SH3-like domain-containing protein
LLANNMMVQVLPDIAEAKTVIWVKVRTEEGIEGWIVQSLLQTATPAPGW